MTEEQKFIFDLKGYLIPEVHRQTDSPLFETYSCPPGSVIIFTENLCHSGVA